MNRSSGFAGVAQAQHRATRCGGAARRGGAWLGGGVGQASPSASPRTDRAGLLLGPTAWLAGGTD